MTDLGLQIAHLIDFHSQILIQPFNFLIHDGHFILILRQSPEFELNIITQRHFLGLNRFFQEMIKTIDFLKRNYDSFLILSQVFPTFFYFSISIADLQLILLNNSLFL